jgi:hypothetical protein
VERAFQAAFVATDEAQRVQCLMTLRGIGVPITSCILAWTFPDRWGVIDSRAWTTIWRQGLVQERSDGTNLGPQQWKLYCAIVSVLSQATGFRPQHIDLLLYDHGAN